jgi:POT family proton-dependent oligopeptide transporter
MEKTIPSPGERSSFPKVFWVANIIEILERFAYYGIYIPFGIYMTSLGFSELQLGIIQSLFLFVSYFIPIFSGTFADKFGFKKVLIISYLAYLPSILLLIVTKTFSGILLTMLCIGLAAGIFKPLIAGTVRVVTDKTNKTLGFGIFYQMVNVGASLGPVVVGLLRDKDWNYAFYAAAAGAALMLLITIFFYKEPERKIEGVTLRKKFKDIGTALSDLKFLAFLVILGVFFWLPFWAFFNLIALYVDRNLDTARLYLALKSVSWEGFANFFSSYDDGVWRLKGEMLGHTGYIIMIFQFMVSRVSEKFKAIPTFLVGLFLAAVGLVVIGFANISTPTLVFLGIFFFAIGEMVSSPRIQEYITWLAPKEKAGLYMGSNFLAIMIGAFLSGFTYTILYGVLQKMGSAEFIWYLMAVHLVAGIIVIYLFMRSGRELKEREE